MSNEERTEVLQGTLDLMILQTLASLGPQHGYAVAARLEQVSGGALQLNMGTLYPGLTRLEARGLVTARWGQTESNRRARFYELTARGRRQLEQERASGSGWPASWRGCWSSHARMALAPAAMWRRDRTSDARRDELQFHFDAEVEAAMARGLSADEARREARRRVGSVPAGEVAAHEGLGIRALDALARDVRHATRSLTHHAAFTTLAGSVLVLSVAVAVLLFALFDGVLLRPLPYRQPDRLRAHLRQLAGAAALPDGDRPLPRVPSRRDVARRPRALHRPRRRVERRWPPLGAPDRRRDHRRSTSRCSAGRRRRAARSPTATSQPGTRNVILSDGRGAPVQRRSRRSSAVPFRLNRQSWTVVGVMPAGFQHVGGDYRSPPQGDTVDVWLPLSIDSDRTRQPARLALLQRGRPGPRRTIAAAGAAGTGGPRRRVTRSATRSSGRGRPTSRRCFGEVTGRSRSLVTLLAVAAALVLAVACANIAGLCVARALTRAEGRGGPACARRQPLAAAARGAGREPAGRRIGGAVAGVLLAAWALPVHARLVARDVPAPARGGVHGAQRRVRRDRRAGAVLLATRARGQAARGLAATGARTTAGRRTRRLRTAAGGRSRSHWRASCAPARSSCGGTTARLTAQDHGFAPRAC